MMTIFRAVYNLLWGDLINIPLPGRSTLGISLLVMILIPAGLYFTIRTRFLPFRLFPEMLRITLESNKKTDTTGISGLQALIVSTACRVGMGNLVGIVAAISAGGAGAVFWMWVIALLGSSTAFIDTIIICSCSAMIMLLTPEELTTGLVGMDLLQSSMNYHLGSFGVIFIAVILFLFSFSTFLGILFYARSNVAYLFGDNWVSQTLYKVLALSMLFAGGLTAYQFVWDLGDIGICLMTVFNMIALFPLAPKALEALQDYERNRMKKSEKN